MTNDSTNQIDSKIKDESIGTDAEVKLGNVADQIISPLL